MMIGAIGIALGLMLYGPRLIKTVGSEITELDQVRAYSIAMAAAITVIIASQLGLPVSTTHIAIGGVFGVGFLREWLDRKESNRSHYVKRHYVWKIASAWIITVPVAATLSAIIFLAIRTIMIG
jgi:PiT family inorganic phosphate transporter